MSFDREKTIFLSALDIPSDADREAFIDAQCGDDQNLKAAVVELLSAHDRSINVLDQQTPQRKALQGQVKSAAEAIALNSTWGRESQGNLAPPAEGSVLIEDYVLLEKLGEGGFGQVYVAEQRVPVRRRVAIKLLKATALSPDAMARFEAERQALAMMDHPNIATIFDAGTTSTGQPYFVMELVRGVDIIRFCRENNFSIQKRLELFLDVCHAVQHAHQKGIIHRDLKPSNVLVTLHDADAVVKVIDFGVAKALREPLTDRTIYTRFAQMIGTPMYMSPEQAEMNSLDVDTRSDIYSLGVLLYELLTEQTPFDQHRLQTASFDEMRRMIREEDPPRPSARLTTSMPTENLQAASTRRSTRTATSRTLASELRGDLDWIVMKSLEKDRRRRYETAADLARDVQRYLDQQPVVARPPSSWYRFSRFVRRNRTMFTATVLVVAVLISGSIVSTWLAIKATIAQKEAEDLRHEAVQSVDKLKEANVLLDSARANADEQRYTDALSQYSKAIELQPNHYLAWSGRGALLARLGGWQRAEQDYAEALKLGAPANNPSWWGVPQLCFYVGDQQSYDTICKRMKHQLEETDDFGQLAMIARGLSLQSRGEAEMASLATKIEELVRAQKQDEQNRRGPTGIRFRPGPGQPPHKMPFPGDPGLGPMVGPGGGPGGPGIMRDILTYSAGVVSYRSGNPQRAIELLSEVRLRDAEGPFGSMASPILALAYHQTGQLDLAEKEFAASQDSMNRWLDEMKSNADVPRFPWFDFLELCIWHQEAAAALGVFPQDVESRIGEIEQHTDDLLHQSILRQVEEAK